MRTRITIGLRKAWRTSVLPAKEERDTAGWEVRPAATQVRKSTCCPWEPRANEGQCKAPFYTEATVMAGVEDLCEPQKPGARVTMGMWLGWWLLPGWGIGRA